MAHNSSSAIIYPILEYYNDSPPTIPMAAISPAFGMSSSSPSPAAHKSKSSPSPGGSAAWVIEVDPSPEKRN